MRSYFKQSKEDGALEALLTYDFEPTITDPLIVAITEEEYSALLAELEAATPEEPVDPDEISDSEALAILLGGEDA